MVKLLDQDFISAKSAKIEQNYNNAKTKSEAYDSHQPQSKLLSFKSTKHEDRGK